MARANQKTLLWVVPRIPWPPRCGASHANCELIRAMSERGFRIHLICFSTQSTKVDLEEIREALSIDEIDVLQTSLLFKFRWIRFICSLALQIFSPRCPVTVLPFASKGFLRALSVKVKLVSPVSVIWDGLHPMVAIQRLTGSEFSKLNHIYRAHNIETMIWTGYQKALPKIFAGIFRAQVDKMRDFENSCFSAASGVAFVQEDDQIWFRRYISTEKATRVVPISIKMKPDVVERQIARWRKNKTSSDTHQNLSILWLGGLDWWPNKQGLDWFMQNVWKKVKQQRPDATLTLVGRGTERVIDSLDSRARALGFAENLDEVFSLSDVLIAPIQSGGGIRVKALESLSRGVPCIGTSLGVLGVPRSGVFCCDSADQWINVLSHLTPQECLWKGMMGWRALQSDFSRDKSSERMEELILEAQLRKSAH